ncbi:hypothetical protein LY76DRAFT_157003 [Colletotrichum caudatum]|nr:hypothetical protein LY76DRAFT_157003 [Colletotrichum caudatum]
MIVKESAGKPNRPDSRFTCRCPRQAGILNTPSPAAPGPHAKETGKASCQDQTRSSFPVSRQPISWVGGRNQRQFPVYGKVCHHRTPAPRFHSLRSLCPGWCTRPGENLLRRISPPLPSPLPVFGKDSGFRQPNPGGRRLICGTAFLVVVAAQ